MSVHMEIPIIPDEYFMTYRALEEIIHTVANPLERIRFDILTKNKLRLMYLNVDGVDCFVAVKRALNGEFLYYIGDVTPGPEEYVGVDTSEDQEVYCAPTYGTEYLRLMAYNRDIAV